MATVRFRIDYILNTTTKTLTWTDITSDWITPANMRILIWIVAPSGITIYKNAGYDAGDYSAPDINPGGGSKTGIVLPLDSSGGAYQGTYQFYCKAQDDGTSVQYAGSNTYDFQYSAPVVSIALSYSCRASELYSTDETDYDIDSVTPSITRTHTITKPAGSGANDPGSTAAASRIIGGGSTAATRLWTGTWVISISSIVYYAMATWGGSGWISITDTLTGTDSIAVSSVDNIAGMMDSISALFDRRDTAITESYSDAERLKTVADQIINLWMEYEQAQRMGEDYSVYALEIAGLLNQEGYTATLNSSTSVVIVPWGEGTGLPTGNVITFVVDAPTIGGNDGDMAIGTGPATLWNVYNKQGGSWVYMGNISGSIIGIAYAALTLTNSIVNADINAAAAIAYSKLALTNSILNADINAAAAIAYTKLNLAGGIVNTDIHAAAAIAYTKLNLATSIVNADINAAAAIAYSKLALTNSVVNADIAAAAAIAYSKLNISGSVVNADIHAAAAIAYTKLALTGAILNADIHAAAAIAYSKLNLTGSIVNADIGAAAAIAFSKMAALTASRLLASDGSGIVIPLDTATYPSLTELSYLKGITSAIQTQINSLTTKTLAQGSIMVGNAGSEAAAISLKANAQIPIGNGTTVAPQPVTGAIAITNAGVTSINAGYIAPTMLNTENRRRVIIINVDWKAGFLGAKKIRIPWYCYLDHIYVCVDQAIGATDDATITFKDEAGNNMSGGSLAAGVLTIGTSVALGTVVQSAVTGNNDFEPGDAISIDTRKATPNTGTAWVTLTFIMADS